MPEFRTIPEALADAARAVTADGRLVDQVAGALGSSLHEIGDALPGSGTAHETERLGDALAAAARSLAAELASIGAALALAAQEYVAVDESVTGNLRSAGRWSL
jgi:hypothetical protein